MKRYARVYLQLLSFSIKQFFTYRANALVRSFFFPAWQVALFGVIHVMYLQSPVVAGWTRDEALLLYLICQLFMCVTYFSFFEGGARYFMDKSVRYGEFDFVLTKPLNPQFLAMFSRPDVSPLLGFISLGLLTIRHLSTSSLHIEVSQLPLFLISLMLSYSIVYFCTSTYATWAFYTVQARQIIEIIDKATEYSYYPLDAFAQPVRVFMLTALPVFFFGNVSTAFLLGKGNPWLVGLMGTMTVVSVLANHIAWLRGLKHYSSASS